MERGAAAPALGVAEIADRPGGVEREVEVAAAVARADRGKCAGRTKADDVRDAVAIDVADDARRLVDRPALVRPEISHRQIELAERLAAVRRRVLAHRYKDARRAEREDVVEARCRILDNVAQRHSVAPALRLAEIGAAAGPDMRGLKRAE